LLAKTGAASATLDGKMSILYRIGCWLVGLGMVGVAVLGSLFAGRTAAR